MLISGSKDHIVIATRVLAVGLTIFFLAVGARGQVSSASVSDHPSTKCDDKVRSTYLLGPDDQLEISGPELTEFGNKPARIDSDGNIQAPLVGRIHVAGLTVQQVEQQLDRALQKYIRGPQDTVNVTETRTQTVAVQGQEN